jgi:hypothetical protein
MNLEDLISFRALDSLQSKLENQLDMKSWSVENRDQQLSTAWEVAQTIVDESAGLSLQLLAKEVDGKPFIYWNLRSQVLGALVDYLRGERELLDKMDAGETAIYPVDYNWLGEQIRKYDQLYAETLTKIETYLNGLKNDTMAEVSEL